MPSLTRILRVRKLGSVKVTLSIDDELLQRARRQADILGTSVNQLVREYLGLLAANADANQDAIEFERLSRVSGGDSSGRKFQREELHKRR